MFWITILILIAGAALIKLGALSVLVSVLKVVIGFIAPTKRNIAHKWKKATPRDGLLHFQFHIPPFISF